MEFFMKVASSTTGSASQGLTLGMVIGFIVVVCVLVAYLLAMELITNIAEEKGYHISGRLWFIGLFGLIVTPAIIVAALPNKKQNASSNKNSKSVEEELPAI